MRLQFRLHSRKTHDDKSAVKMSILGKLHTIYTNYKYPFVCRFMLCSGEFGTTLSLKNIIHNKTNRLQLITVSIPYREELVVA